MKYTYVDLMTKIPYEMDSLGVEDQFKTDGLKGKDLNDACNTVKNWVTYKTVKYALYRIE